MKHKKYNFVLIVAYIRQTLGAKIHPEDTEPNKGATGAKRYNNVTSYHHMNQSVLCALLWCKRAQENCVLILCVCCVYVQMFHISLTVVHQIPMISNIICFQVPQRSVAWPVSRPWRLSRVVVVWTSWVVISWKCPLRMTRMAWRQWWQPTCSLKCCAYYPGCLIMTCQSNLYNHRVCVNVVDGWYRVQSNGYFTIRLLPSQIFTPTTRYCLWPIEAKWYMYVSLICITVGSNNGVLRVPRQAIVWTNAAVLLIGSFGNTFQCKFSSRYKKIHSKMSSAKMAFT